MIVIVKECQYKFLHSKVMPQILKPELININLININ